MNEPQVFLLTGCASGMGRHLAGALVRRGMRLVAADINLAAMQALADEQSWPDDRVELCHLDVRDAEAWRHTVKCAVERFGRIDVAMNLAGVIEPGYVHELSAEAIDRHVDINAKGLMYGTREVSIQMIAQGGGHIVNFASLAGIASIPGIGLYSASKHAVRGFSLAVAHELRRHKVAVTVVCPDLVDTPMLDLQLDYEEAALTFSGSRPLTVDQIERLIFKTVLRRRPLEVVIPRRRGWLAKLANAWPSLTVPMIRNLTRKGRARQAAAKESRNLGALTESNPTRE